LMLRQVAALAIARRTNQEDGSNETSYDSCRHERLRVLLVLLAQEVERPDSGHHESTGKHRARHVVEVLPESPRVQHEAPEACKRSGTVGLDRVPLRMLHPRIGGND